MSYHVVERFLINYQKKLSRHVNISKSLDRILQPQIFRLVSPLSLLQIKFELAIFYMNSAVCLKLNNYCPRKQAHCLSEETPQNCATTLENFKA